MEKQPSVKPASLPLLPRSNPKQGNELLYLLLIQRIALCRALGLA